MSTSYRQGTDVWLTPIVIEEGTEIAWTETAGALTAAIPAGTYYGSATVNAPGYASLYDTIIAAMNGVSALSGNAITYTVEARTPRYSIAQPWGGIALKGSSANFLGLDLDNTNAQILWDVLGFGTALAGGVIASVAQASGSGREVVGWLTRAGCWTSPVYASSRARTPRRIIEWATPYTERDDAYAVDYGDRATRRWVYEWVAAAHVFTDRADDLQYAEVADLYPGDVHNAFEATWRSLAQLDDVLVVHHPEGLPVTLSLASRLYDVVRLADVAAAQDFDRVAELMRMAGEWYRLAIDCTIRGGTNGY